MSAFKRRAAIAVATAGVATAMWGAVMPDQKTMTPEGRQQQLIEQASDQRERELEERRRKGLEQGEANRREKLRAAEVRRREAARKAARKLVRRP